MVRIYASSVVAENPLVSAFVRIQYNPSGNQIFQHPVCAPFSRQFQIWVNSSADVAPVEQKKSAQSA
ncbi:MAG: hypothetical protein D6755_05070 [Anaerolineae bacterium]|nr:MAG: hypothetical protein D6755_05070 [Anaerolineae bacterium]